MQRGVGVFAADSASSWSSLRASATAVPGTFSATLSTSL